MNFLIIMGLIIGCQAANDQISITKVFNIKQSEKIVFNNITRIAVDAKSNLYILDIKEQTIYVYDESGEYKKNIGNPGQGPGEFGRAVSIYIDSKGYIYVLDNSNRKVKVFDNNGKYINDVLIKGYPDNGVNIIVDNDKNIYITGDYGNTNSILTKFSSNGDLICQFPLPKPEYKEIDVGKNYQNYVSGYLSGGSMCFDNDNNIWISYRWPYLIYKFTLDGRKISQINNKSNVNWMPMIFRTESGRITLGPFTQSSNIFIIKNKYIVNAINVIDWKGDPKAKIDSSALSREPRKYYNIKRIYGVIDIYSFDGDYINSIEIEGKVSYIASDKKENMFVIMNNEDDIPSIIKYEIKINQKK